MRKLTLFTLATACATLTVLGASRTDAAAPSANSATTVEEQSFTGVISDDMCGLDHAAMGETDEKACTLSCTKSGSDFVLADKEHKKVYLLDDQKAPKEFAGAKVVVTGTLKDDTIHVTKIVPAKP
ncbi:MAG: hypothetical protein ABI609_08665 [Acidobacteriota bacterium]